MSQPRITYLPGAAPNECRAEAVPTDGSPRPVALRVDRVGSQLALTLLDRSSGTPGTTVLVAYPQAQKLAEVVMEVVGEIEDEGLLDAPPEPEA